MQRNDRDVTGGIQTTDPGAVGAEVVRLFQGLFPAASPRALERAFQDAARLYGGEDRDYAPCDTEYHDIQHVLDVTLAMARLMEGYQRSRRAEEEPLHAALFTAGAAAALFHDFGYLRRRSDRHHRYGAEYTMTHVSRGAAFLRRYARRIGLDEPLAQLAAELLHFTGYERPTETIRLDGLPRRLGQMLGTADIIAQMSDRCYLEKCRDRLYPEFVLGRLGAAERPAMRALPAFASGEELVHKTPRFYKGAMKRLDLQLARSYVFAARHFGGENLYLDAMRRNAHHAESVASAADAVPLLRRRPPHTLKPEVQPYPRGLIGL